MIASVELLKQNRLFERNKIECYTLIKSLEKLGNKITDQALKNALNLEISKHKGILSDIEINQAKAFLSDDLGGCISFNSKLNGETLSLLDINKSVKEGKLFKRVDNTEYLKQNLKNAAQYLSDNEDLTTAINELLNYLDDNIADKKSVQNTGNIHQ